jgi:branched-chain amino acid aminotransferase
MSNTAFHDRTGFIWFDGEKTPWQDSRVHVLTHGLHYASSVFEGVRAYNGSIFKLTEHSQRLIKSAEYLDMQIPYSLPEINEACKEACRMNNLKDCYIRPVVWRGSEQMGIAASKAKIHLAVAAWEWPSYFFPELRDQGLKLKTSAWKRPSPESAPVHAKAAGLYMICTLSKHDAERNGYHDALMHDYRGYIAEATGANIFFIKNGEVHTPKADCFLNGITRLTVMDLIRALGMPLHERHIKPEEMADFEECFLTGTAAEVTAVGAIDDYKFTVGDSLKKIRAAYEALIQKPTHDGLIY